MMLWSTRRMSALAVVWFSLATALSVTAGHQPAAISAVQAAIDIPFEFKTRQPIVPVSVNGGPAVPFVVDTGASIHVVDREIARAANAATGTAVQMSGGGQAAVDAQFVDGVNLEAAGLSWPGQRAAVASLGYPDKKHFAGLLGAPILMRYTVRFAFEARTMRLLDPSTYTPPSRGDTRAVRAAGKPANRARDSRRWWRAGRSKADGRYRSQHVHRSQPAIRRSAPARRDHARRDVGGSPGCAWRHCAVSLRDRAPCHVWRCRFDKPRLGLSRAQTGSSSRSERDGIIGNDLLRQFIMTVDYSRRTLVLERP